MTRIRRAGHPPIPSDIVAFAVNGSSGDVFALKPAATMASRYGEAGAPEPLYSSLDPQTPIDELQRRTNLDLEDASLRETILRFQGDLLRACDRESLRALAISKKGLAGHGNRDARLALVDYARSLEAHALLVPSPARPGGLNLIVFHEAVQETITCLRQKIIRVGSRQLGSRRAAHG
jgi:RES domain